MREANLRAWKWWRDYAAWTRTSYNQHYAPINAVVTKMKAAHDIDPERVFITGLSAGGYMTTIMLACFPDIYAAGAAFSGGPHNCDLKCTDSNKQQDWTRPAAYVPPAADDVKNAYPTWWNDATKRKPRLIEFHGGLDQAVKPINLDDAMRQWTGALGIDTTPDNASLGRAGTARRLRVQGVRAGGQARRRDGPDGDLGHGTPVNRGVASTRVASTRIRRRSLPTAARPRIRAAIRTGRTPVASTVRTGPRSSSVSHPSGGGFEEPHFEAAACAWHFQERTGRARPRWSMRYRGSCRSTR